VLFTASMLSNSATTLQTFGLSDKGITFSAAHLSPTDR
jgi:hypothetical protein